MTVAPRSFGSVLFASWWLFASGCAPNPPPRWPEGGAVLVLGAARWDRGREDAVEIRPDGKVLVDGDLEFVIDRVGRAVDDDYEPLAILLPDGQVRGTDDRPLGRVGVTNASAPGAVEAWLAVTPDGRVTYFDPDGEREPGGVWSGCTGPLLRTCTFVTHLVAMRNYRPAPSTGVSVGVGVGIGF